MDIVEWIQKNNEWLFSGIGCIVVGLILEYFRNKKDVLSNTNINNQQINYGSGNKTQIINQNYITNESQRKNDAKKNDLLLLEYIDNIINSLKKANEDLKYFGVTNSNVWYFCITNAIPDNNWENYLEKTSLPPHDIFKLKKWFNSVAKLTQCVTRSQVISNMDNIVNWINDIIYDQNMYILRSQLGNQQED